jgi:hypothetical protein
VTARARWKETSDRASRSPELAALDALDVTLKLVMTVLVTANPELLSEPIPSWASSQVWTAHAVVTCVDALRVVLEPYRAAVERAHHHAWPDDMPF